MSFSTSQAMPVNHEKMEKKSIRAQEKALAFDIRSKCPHKVKGCRKCRVYPLLDQNGEVVSCFLEHNKKCGQIIKCTLGMKNINTWRWRGQTLSHEETLEQKIKLEAAAILTKMRNTPESGEEPSSVVAEPATSQEPPVKEISVDSELAKLHECEASQVTADITDTKHMRASLGMQMEKVQTQMKSTFSAGVIKQATRSIEQLVLLLVGLQYDTSLEAIVVRCVTFLSAITEGGVVSTLHDILTEYIKDAEIPDILQGKSVKEAFTVEKVTNAPEMIGADALAVWDTLKQGIFTKHLSFILGTVFAFSTCKIKNVKFNHPIYEKMMEYANAEEIDGMDLIDHGIKLYNWMSTVGMACIQEGSLEPMMMSSKTLTNAMKDCTIGRRDFMR
jgi:hypothetical protein